MPKHPETSADASRVDEAAEPSDTPSSSSLEGSDSTDTTAFPPENHPKEYGGRNGPDPVRYGDWEKNGRCIDF